LGLVELSPRMRPAQRQAQIAALLHQRLVRLLAVADDGAAKAVDERGGEPGRAARRDAIKHRARAGQAPYPPLLARRAVHEPPPGLVHADDVIADDVVPQELVDGLPQPRQRLELIPQRLRRDLQPQTLHAAALPVERLM